MTNCCLSGIAERVYNGDEVIVWLSVALLRLMFTLTLATKHYAAPPP